MSLYVKLYCLKTHLKIEFKIVEPSKWRNVMKSSEKGYNPVMLYPGSGLKGQVHPVSAGQSVYSVLMATFFKKNS
jgi:hypothetical protein